jgi:hypothetical protein
MADEAWELLDFISINSDNLDPYKGDEPAMDLL